MDIDDPRLINDPRTVMALLYGDQSTGEMLACVDSIRIPGRRAKAHDNTRGSPVVADIDGDNKQEILIGSTRGGLFAWEPSWNSSADSFECIPEKGWPLVFPEEPPSPVVGDLEGDGWLELVVAAGDYVYVYDLPALNVQTLWPMPGYDVQRTGYVGGGGGGERPAPRDPDETISGEPGMMPSGPNPLGKTTMLKYRVPFKTRVELGVYDVTGRRVQELKNETLERGVYEQVWDGRSESGNPLASGVYFVRIKIGDFEQSRKLLIAR